MADSSEAAFISDNTTTAVGLIQEKQFKAAFDVSVYSFTA